MFVADVDRVMATPKRKLDAKRCDVFLCCEDENINSYYTYLKQFIYVESQILQLFILWLSQTDIYDLARP